MKRTGRGFHRVVERLGVEPRLAVLQTAVQTRYTISREIALDKEMCLTVKTGLEPATSPV